MTTFLLYAAAALALPVGAVVMAHIALWQLDRELARKPAKAHPDRPSRG